MDEHAKAQRDEGDADAQRGEHEGVSTTLNEMRTISAKLY
jgi:hypothetical protein